MRSIWAAGCIAIALYGAPAWADEAQHAGLYVSEAAKDDEIAWVSTDTIVFIGNKSGGAEDKRPADSLYMWKLGAPPKEIIPAPPGKITAIKAIGEGRVLVEISSRELDVRSERWVHSYYLIDNGVSRNTTVAEYEQFLADIHPTATERQSLELRAHELVGRKAADFFRVIFSADGEKALVYDDINISSSPGRNAWKVSDCWEYHTIDFKAGVAERGCVPFAGWADIPVVLIPMGNETLTLASAWNSIRDEDWQPNLFGLYRVAGERIVNLNPNKYVRAARPSPDGCHLALAQRDVPFGSPPDVSDDNLMLDVLDICTK